MIEERRLCFIGHVTRFVHTQTSLQPLNKLLWFVPQGATRRPTHRNRITFHDNLKNGLGVQLGEIHAKAFECDNNQFTDWYFERCERTWVQWMANETPRRTDRSVM